MHLFLILSVAAGWSIDGAYKKKLDALYRKSVPLITARELKGKMEMGEILYILDTREAEEYQVSRIENARSVGYKKFKPASMNGIPLNSLVIVYCSVGYRSEKIGEKLFRLGYTRVYNLYGGIFEWINLGYPVFSDDGTVTNTIHGYSKKWSKWLQRGEIVY